MKIRKDFKSLASFMFLMFAPFTYYMYREEIYKR
jgi:hypothetical protein